MVSGTLKPYLRRDVAMMSMYPLLNSKLTWLSPDAGNYVKRIEVDTDAITYLKQTYTPSTDPKKELAPDREPGSGFPEIDRTRMTDAPAVLTEKGFRLRIPQKVLKDSRKAKVEIQENYEYAAYLLGETVNGNMYSEITAQANTTTSRFSPAETWDNAGGTAKPIIDLTHLAQDMDNADQPFIGNSFFVEKVNFWELNDYLLTVDVDSWKQQNLYGQPTVSDDFIDIPKLGRVYKTTGALHGSVLAMDRNNPAIEYYYRLDPEKANPTIDYTVKENGKERMVSTDNFGFHYRWFQEQNSEDIIQEFSADFVCVVKKPYGVKYKSTGI
jgi:hypothetical protein